MKPIHIAIVFLVLMLCVGSVSATSAYSYVLHKSVGTKAPVLTIYGPDKTTTTVQIREVTPLKGMRCLIPVAHF
jgi:hypothetical protein